ncbi:MAG TPA: hypothetical protein VFD58_36460 [Blastocatellia bacterium]|nr:hypothetical protein [Blastocatellia bacterium]
MEPYINVWYRGKELSIFDSVAESFDLREGQQLPPDQFLPLLQANIDHAIAVSQLNRAIASVFDPEPDGSDGDQDSDERSWLSPRRAH